MSQEQRERYAAMKREVEAKEIEGHDMVLARILLVAMFSLLDDDDRAALRATHPPN